MTVTSSTIQNVPDQPVPMPVLLIRKVLLQRKVGPGFQRVFPKFILGEASFVHGGWDDPEDEYLYKITPSYFERFNEKFFFCGHTHVQKYIDLKNGQFFTNPGSVGQPRDGINTASYCLFDEKKG